jgi:hypothetical protein
MSGDRLYRAAPTPNRKTGVDRERVPHTLATRSPLRNVVPLRPGLTRPVSLSEYATLTGASEAAVLASIRALKAAKSSLSLARARTRGEQ